MLHHKSGFTLSIIIYKTLKKVFDLLLFEGSYLMRPEDRAVVSYEPNLFYRHLVHAYGARGLAMTRVVKSDDDELEDIAEEFLVFHEDIKEEPGFIKFSIEASLSDLSLDSDRCFLKCAQQMSDTLGTASEKISKMESVIPFLDGVHGFHEYDDLPEKRVIPKKGDHNKINE